MTHKALMHFLHRALHWLTFISVWKREDRRQVALRLPASAIDGFVRSCAAEKTWIWSQTAGREDGKSDLETRPKTERWKKVEWNSKKKKAVQETQQAGRDSCCAQVEALLRAKVICRDFTLGKRNCSAMKTEEERREFCSSKSTEQQSDVETGARVYTGRQGIGIHARRWLCVLFCCFRVLWFGLEWRVTHCELQHCAVARTVQWSENMVSLGRNSGVTPISQRASPLGQPESWLIYIHLPLYNTHMSNQQLKVRNGHEW